MNRWGYFNWRLAAVLVLAVVVVATTAVGIRQIQQAGRGQAALRAGKAAYDRGDWLEAASNLGRYISGHPQDVNVLMLYADAQLQIRPQRPGNVQQAIAAYRNVLRLDRSNLEAARRLIEIYLAGGAAGEAELTARTFLQDNQGPYPQIQLMLGGALAQLGRFKEAVGQWMQIIENSPTYIQAYEAIGRLASQRPQDVNQPTEHWLDLAVQKNPSSALARIVRAGYYAAAGRQSDAIADLDAAESMDINDIQVRLRLVRQLLQMGQLDRAKAHLEQATKVYPDEPGVWQVWAEIAARSGDPNLMADVAQKGLDHLKARQWDFMPQAAELFTQAGQLDKAAACINQLKDKDILPQVTAFLEGLLEARKGRLPAAIGAWHKAMALGLRSSQVRLLLASAYTQQGDLVAAGEQLQALCADEPNMPGAHLALARHLARIGDWAGVRDRAQAVLRIVPGAVDARLLDIEAQIQQLAQAGTPAGDPTWSQIDAQLSSLASVPQVANQARFLMLQAALARSDLAGARAIAEGIEPTSEEDGLRLELARAEILVRSGQSAHAEEALRQTAERYPQAAQPIRALAAIYLERAELAKAQELLESALARIRPGAAKRDLTLLLCTVYDRAGQVDRSIALLDSATKAEPNAIWPRMGMLGYTKVVTDTSRAQGLVDQIKAIEGQSGSQWRMAQARVWLASSDFGRYYPQLVNLLKENIASRPGDVESWRLLAAAYEKAGELQLALTTYRQALDKGPDDLALVVATVSALYKAREYQQAEQILQDAASRQLTHPALDGLRFQGLLRLGQLDRAADIAQQVWTADPNNLQAGLSLAMLRAQQGQVEQARQMLEQILQTDPNWLPAGSALVQVYLRQGRSDLAMELCNRFVERRGDPGSYILRGRLLASLGQDQQAAADLGRAVGMAPTDPEVWLARAQFYRSKGSVDQATADVDKALSVAPDNPIVQAQAIELFMTSGDAKRRAQARQMVEDAIKARPDDPQMQLFKVRFLLADRLAPSDAQAEQVLQQLTSNVPRLREAWLLWAEMLLDQANPGKALDVVLRGLAHHPNDRGLLRLKARAEASRSSVLAVQTLRTLYELDPNDTEVVLQLANAYITSGDPDRAVVLLDGHLKVCNPASRSRCQALLAVALHSLGRKDQAAEVLSQLASAVPDQPLVTATRARILAADAQWSQLVELARAWLDGHPNDVDTAILIAMDLARSQDKQARDAAGRVLGLVVERQPNSTRAMLFLAQHLQQLGDSQQAAGLYRRILGLDPKNVIAMNNLAWILSEQMDQPEEALSLANKGLGISPDYLDLIDTRGVIYYRLGRLDQAEQDLAKAAGLYPLGHPAGVGARVHLAQVYAKQGKRQDAARLLREALDMQARFGGLSAEELEQAKVLLEQVSR